MTDEQWHRLHAVMGGEVCDGLPAASIMNSAWLPNWAGTAIKV